MCYYLNVQFQGQRVKQTLLRSITAVSSCGSSPSWNSLQFLEQEGVAIFIVLTPHAIFARYRYVGGMWIVYNTEFACLDSVLEELSNADPRLVVYHAEQK